MNRYRLTDPNSRSMATSGRGSAVVGYNVQVAVDTEHHLSVTHEVTNVGSDRSRLAHVAKQAKATLQTDALEAVADRGYFSGEEILACRSCPANGDCRGVARCRFQARRVSGGRFATPGSERVPRHDCSRSHGPESGRAGSSRPELGRDALQRPRMAVSPEARR
jgi:hypothetical protein